MPQDKPFAADNPPLLTIEQAKAYAAGRARPIGPPHLKIIEVDFLKPAASNPRERPDDYE